ncbi:MAG: hypothetical protein JXR86_13625 [Spirochaetales bacterium]|nr:hypothetical protein [Spirochaetales bacterium]
MSDAGIPLFSNMEKQILQEIMNIAFGSASGDLENIIGLSVILHIPEVIILPADELAGFLASNLPLNENSSVVEQAFKGNFSGSALLLFPDEIQPRFLAALSGHKNLSEEGEADRERIREEVFLEIGNILIGTTVGKITELLKTSVTYKSPETATGKMEDFKHIPGHFKENSSAIILKTYFSFKDHGLKGTMMIVTSHKSVIWMKNALNSFLEAYR